jgi:polyferredoxin
MRLVGYAAIIGIMLTIFATMLALRVPLEVETIRDRNQLYRENSQGMIENVYLLKVLNKSQKTRHLTVTLKSDKHISMSKPVVLAIEAGDLASLPVTLVADPEELHHSKYEVTFMVQDSDDAGLNKTSESRFFAPAQHEGGDHD